jgi:protein ImuB
MAHWLCIRMPQLPLEVFSRAGNEQQPLAVGHDGRRARVLLCNRAARERGVQPDIGVAAARALAHDLIVRHRDPGAEQAALQALAAWACQFTDRISLYPPAALLLEVQGSFMLFGGLDALLDTIRGGLATLGYTTRLASAPTPLAAVSLARCGSEQHIDAQEHLPTVLASLPVSVLDWEQPLIDRLDGMGVHQLGDLLRLPRDGLARRFGPHSLLYLDRMLGRCPHPLNLYQPPQRFIRRLPLPVEVEQTQALLFALQRLLQELCGWLRGQGAGIQRFDIDLYHRDQQVSRLKLQTRQPGRDAGQFTGLLRERLERLELPSPVIEIELRAAQTVPLDARSQDMFEHDGKTGQIELLDRLRARLGERAITGISAVAEHRPECAWRYTDPGNSEACSNGRQRPLWLLSVPRPLQTRNGHPQLQGDLRLESGLERIESGWWDGHEVARDYFVATNPAGSSYWIYRELTGERGWYLQGVFE